MLTCLNIVSTFKQDMDFSNTKTTLNAQHATSDVGDTFTLVWRHSPVKYETLLAMLSPASQLRPLLSLDQFVFNNVTMTRTILRKMLGWNENLHPGTKIELEVASDEIFTLRRTKILTIAAEMPGISEDEPTVGVVTLDVSQSGWLTRLELQFPLSN